jgi:hypothetical protein
MEDVIQTYMLPYDRRFPVVCFDEACKQLFGEVRQKRKPRPGSHAKVDYEYDVIGRPKQATSGRRQTRPL